MDVIAEDWLRVCAGQHGVTYIGILVVLHRLVLGWVLHILPAAPPPRSHPPPPGAGLAPANWHARERSIENKCKQDNGFHVVGVESRAA